MGMKETFQGVAKALFAAFGNVKVEGTCTYRVQTTTHVPGTGTTTVASDTNLTDKAFLVGYNSDQIDNERILANDQMLIVQQADLAVTPNNNDIVILADGTWEVKNWEQDPAEAAYFIQIRKPGVV